jgi:hypothetical protein
VHQVSRTPLVALLALVTVLASLHLLGGAAAQAAESPAPDRADRKVGRLLYPVLDRRFTASKQDVFSGAGRFGRVVSGRLPRGIRVERGVLVGRATRVGLVTARIVVTKEGQRTVRRLSFRVLRPQAARPGTTLVTKSRGESLSGSGDVDVSADGGVVTFTSGDDGLVAGDDNGAEDVFAWTRSTGEISLVSRAVGGGSGDAPSQDAAISADGRYVVFRSSATDLTAELGTRQDEVYVRDLATNALAKVSRGVDRPLRWRDPQVLDDGSVVFTGFFYAQAAGADKVWRWDRGTTTVAQVPAPTPQADIAGVSGDGRWQVWWDNNVLLVTQAATGAEIGRCDLVSFDSLGDATFSADGDRVVVDGFGPPAGGGVGGDRLRAFCDVRTGQGAVSIGAAGMTADGNTVAQTSVLPRPLPSRFYDVRVGDYPEASRSVFRHATSTTFADVAISADGSTVVYVTDANNVLDADRDRTADVFVWDRRAR